MKREKQHMPAALEERLAIGTHRVLRAIFRPDSARKYYWRRIARRVPGPRASRGRERSPGTVEMTLARARRT